MAYRVKLGHPINTLRRVSKEARSFTKCEGMHPAGEIFAFEKVVIGYFNGRDRLALESGRQRWPNYDRAEKRVILIEDIYSKDPTVTRNLIYGAKEVIDLWSRYTADLENPDKLEGHHQVLLEQWKLVVRLLEKHLVLTLPERRRLQRGEGVNILLGGTIEFEL
jgi:hypothetical protein